MCVTARLVAVGSTLGSTQYDLRNRVLYFLADKQHLELEK